MWFLRCLAYKEEVSLKDKSKLSVIVAIISSFISLLVLLFGNNIYDRLNNNSTLIIETSKTNQFLPDKLLEIMNDNTLKNNNRPSADSLRVIKIKNKGISSKNLRIQLDLDGSIFDYKIESTESIKDSSISSNSTVIVNMDRLSQNASIELIIWFHEDYKNFYASYSDDISSNIIPYNENKNTTKKSIVIIILVVILIESVLFIINSLRRMNIAKKEREKTELLDYVLTGINNSFSEEDTTISESESKSPGPSEKDHALERLSKLIEKKS